MRKTLSSIIAVASVALSANAVTQSGGFSDWGKLQLVKNQLSSFTTGEPVQLRGWSTFSIHQNDDQGCLGADQWQMMQQYGANVVRLAVSVDGETPSFSDPAYFKNLVKKSISECFELGMYVIVDWHISENNGKSGDPNEFLYESLDFFSEISMFCAEKEYTNVLYEICNEPKTPGWKNIKSYAEKLIPVIVKNQPDAIIIVGTNNWCQDILDPVGNPIDDKFKKNVMYSFHYSACSHYHFLGAFRKAQASIPLFVTEWSAYKFDGTGDYCKRNSDELIQSCGENNYREPQIVSWCVWNWSNGSENASFFTDSCAVGNESKLVSRETNETYGSYVANLMSGVVPCVGCGVTPAPFEPLNKIPTTPSQLWNWDAYNLGGEGVAYHDANSSAWKRDELGNVIDYNIGDEVDVYSLAQEMQWLDKPCPWSTVEDGRVIAFSDSIKTDWVDEYNEDLPTYKSLNAGRNYSGTAGSRRPDEGVDMYGASCSGTAYEYRGYQTLILVEEGEWINYTVDVEKPGYYKISGVISSEYKALGGEISIVSSDGNHLRGASSIKDPSRVTSFGFNKLQKCADSNAQFTQPWDCWAVSDAVAKGEKEVYCVFGKAGLNEIRFEFSGDASGVGPLIFTFHSDIKDDFVIPCDCDDDNSNQGGLDSVDDICADASKFTVSPNPTTGEFTVTLAKNVDASVEIVNMAGQIVASQNVNGSATISEPLKSGVYMVVVKTANSVATQKLIVK